MFLEVITRTFNRRPGMLARNQQSLCDLVDRDWQQTLVVDNLRQGINWANMNLANVKACGEYVWILDDDDVCWDRDLVPDLKRVAAGRPGAVIMMRVTHAEFGMLPSDDNWGHAPVFGNIGFPNFAMPAAIWEQYRHKFAEWDCYGADYQWIAYLWEQQIPFAWLNIVAAHCPQRSLGAPEHAC